MADDKELVREIARMEAEARLKSVADRLRFQQETAMSAIKGLTLVNGGAILALLTFIGNQHGAVDAQRLETSFLCFAIGLASALASYLGAYYSQSWYAHSETSDAWNYQLDMRGLKRRHSKVANSERRNGWYFQIFALSCILSSLVFFVRGSFFGLKAIV